MKTPETRLALPINVAQKLRAIRRREFALTCLGGLTWTAAVLLAAMLVAMAVDRAVGWFDPRIRSAFTIGALATAAAAFVLWCLRPLVQRRTLVSTARAIDQTIPELQERWSTVTELSQNTDAAEVRGSEAMIRKVASEAESASGAISPQVVVPARPALRAGRWLAGASGLLALWFAVNFAEATLLAKRFWRPGADISLTQVTSSPGTTWVAKGEELTLKAAITGRTPKGPARVFIRNGHGPEKEVTMTAQAGEAGVFQHSLEDVADSFEYRVRSGDGQTPWHRVTAVDRPTISAVKLTINPPAYSQLPREEKDSLPSLLRVLDSSEVEVGFRSDQPLDGLHLDLGEGRSTRLAAGPDDWYRFRTRATESFTLTASAINTFKLESRNKPTCRISVYEDLPPSVKVLAPSDDLAVLPGEKVNVTFEASDDFGLARAEVLVATTKADGETNELKIPVPLEAGKKQSRQSVELDPKALGLKHGDQLTYVVRVTDTREMQAEGAAPEASAQASAEQASASESSSASAPSDRAADQPPQPQQAEAAEPTPDQDGQAPGDPADAREAVAASANNGKSPDSKPEQASALASTGKQNPTAAKPAEGSQPPPNEMSKRALDAGQSNECAPRNITVDEWAGTFEGERRQKLEIAIDPVLKQIDALLANAQEKTGSLKPPAASAEGLQQAHAEPLNGAKGNLKESIEVTADLKSRTSGTPYAFIGLQVHNIGQAHTTPAQRSLGDVSLAAAEAGVNVPPLDKASFHIDRARAMLADLTKSFETIKREQKIADAMQKLNKMYQIFLEDTQELLGGSKGPINSYNRKIAEVDDEFVEKLKELMEQKKKIMEELAKVLAEDPRMLRRYLAMMQLQGASYRDQMTQLAERQKQISEQVAGWNRSPESDRPSLIERFQQSYAPLQRSVIEDAVKLRENMETWLPLDVKTDHPKVREALARAEGVVQSASETTGSAAASAGLDALSELHGLRGCLPEFSKIETKDKAKLTAFIANRLSEVESLVTAQSGAIKIRESLRSADFPKVAEIVQHRITQDTLTLGGKLEATGEQVAQMSEEIAAKADALIKIVQADILAPQQSSVTLLSERNITAAGEQLEGVVPAFALAENAFDELMRLIIAKLDEAPAPGSPGGSPPLESILAMLENEMKAAEGLGIPCRPINVQMMTDWMKPGNGQGQGQSQGQAQAQAAQAQAREGQAESDRLAKEARERAREALAEANRQSAPPPPEERNAGQRGKARSEAWNKLVSRLEKDLLQGRDNTPPEQYRAAIESYFNAISDSTSRPEK